MAINKTKKQKVYCPADYKFNAEFERRLFRLNKAINNYFLRGSMGDVLPYLHQASSYCFCNRPEILKK